MPDNVIAGLVYQIKGDSSFLRDELQKAEQYGRQSGENIGKQVGDGVTTGAGGRLRDDRGRFVKEGLSGGDYDNTGKGIGEDVGSGILSGVQSSLGSTSSLIKTILQGGLEGIGIEIAHTIVGAIESAIGSVEHLGQEIADIGIRNERVATGFETITKNAEQAKKVIDDINKLSTTTPFKPTELKELGRSLFAAGEPAEKLIPTLRAISTLAAGAGADVGRIGYAYQSALTSGTVYTHVLNEFALAGIPIYKELAATIGINENQVRHYAETGKVSFNTLAETIQRMTSETGLYGGAMEREMGKTFGQLSNFEGNMEVLGQKIWDSISPAAVALISTFTAVTQEVSDNTNLFDGLRAKSQEVAEYLKQHPEYAKELGQVLNDVATQAVNALGDGLKASLEYLKEHPDAIEQVIKGLSEAVTDVFQFGQGFVEGAQAVLQFLSPLQSIVGLVGDITGSAGSMSESFGETVAIVGAISLGVTAVSAVVETAIAVVEGLSAAWGVVMTTIEVAGPILATMVDVTGVIAAIVAGPLLTPVLAVVAAITTGVAIWQNWDSICAAIGDIWSNFVNLIQSIVGHITEGVQHSTVLKTIWDAIMGILENLPLVKLVGYTTDMVTQSGLVQRAWEGLTGILDAIGSKIQGLIQGAKNLVDTLQAGMGIGEYGKSDSQARADIEPQGTVSNAVSNPYVKAALDTIAYGEGTSGKAGYNTMFGGGVFRSLRDHPRQLVSAGGYTSDAAGRYQFLSTTWDGVARQLGLKDFSPESQDKGAVQLLKNRGALGAIEQGRFADVLPKIGQEWASAPGSPYGQPTIPRGEYLSYYQKRLAFYQQQAGASTPSVTAPQMSPPTIPSSSLSVAGKDAASTDLTIKGKEVDQSKQNEQLLAELRKGQDEATKARNKSILDAMKQDQQLQVLSLQKQLATLSDPSAKKAAEDKIKEVQAGGQYDLKLKELQLSRGDLVTQQQRKITDLKSSDPNIKSKAASEPDYALQIKAIDQAIASEQKLREAAIGVDQVQKQTEQAQKQTAADRANRDANAKLAFDTQKNALIEQKAVYEALDTTVGNAHAKLIQDQIDRMDAEQQFTAQLQKEQDKYDDLANQIAVYKKTLTTSQQASDPTLKVMLEQLSTIKKTMDDLKANEASKLKLIDANDVKDAKSLAAALDQVAQNRQKLLATSNESILQAAINNRQQAGDTFGANDLSRQLGITKENQRYQQDLASYQKAYNKGELGDLSDPTQLAAANSALQQLNANAEKLHSINLADVNNQFKTLGETVLDTAKSGFEQFFTSILDGSKSVGQAFSDLVKSLLSQIAKLAVNQLFMNLFGGGGGGGLLGGLFGGGGGGASGGIGSAFGGGGLLTSIFGLKDGGFVLNAASGTIVPNTPSKGFHSGYGAISAALQREGSSSVLAALTPGELVLSVEQTRRFMNMGLGKVFNFASGGIVPGAASQGSGTSGNGIHITVPVSVGDGASGIDGKKLADGLVPGIRSLVQQEMLKQKRPGGLAYG